VSLLVAVNRARTEILDVVQVISLVYAQIEKSELKDQSYKYATAGFRDPNICILNQKISFNFNSHILNQKIPFNFNSQESLTTHNMVA
jgi:hypothetical protein